MPARRGIDCSAGRAGPNRFRAETSPATGFPAGVARSAPAAEDGERAIYSNPRTAIGGRLSEDMTEGYGPEEYLLRRAPVGTFTIRADVYSADALNPNGSSRITAHVIHDFGRSGEREEVIDVELLPGAEEDTRLIGTVRIPR